ncbi:(d)CMP kinase [Oscillospiraceae bacterium CM]|nr:(d)CMP kinase [Oscillospiraceae bacterium CM]
MEKRSIAIDGPSSAGKSTLARLTAQKFGLIYVDTGALYRTVGLYVLKNGVASKDEAAVTALLPEIHLEMRYDPSGVQRMILNGTDVTDEIRLPEASIYASDVSAMAPVRAFLLSMQREIASTYDVVMDGRDIGTVVLPNAGLKIFLTAETDVRARRRYEELCVKGIDTTLNDVRRDLVYRDENDTSRQNAPLKAAVDAVLLDTTDMTLDDTLLRIQGLAQERLGL